jgi:hypothetical protein
MVSIGVEVRYCGRPLGGMSLAHQCDFIHVAATITGSLECSLVTQKGKTCQTLLRNGLAFEGVNAAPFTTVALLMDVGREGVTPSHSDLRTLLLLTPAPAGGPGGGALAGQAALTPTSTRWAPIAL